MLRGGVVLIRCVVLRECVEERIWIGYDRIRIWIGCVEIRMCEVSVKECVRVWALIGSTD